MDEKIEQKALAFAKKIGATIQDKEKFIKHIKEYAAYKAMFWSFSITLIVLLLVLFFIK